MSGTHTVTVGGRGRLVVPAEVRQRLGFEEGTVLVLVEAPDEPGSATVEQALLGGAVCSAANWSEVTQQVLAVRRGVLAG